jgi:hypothetical protein
MEGKDKKQYSAPEIIYEADLEVKAGTPIGGSPVDPGLELFPGAEE